MRQQCEIQDADSIGVERRGSSIRFDIKMAGTEDAFEESLVYLRDEQAKDFAYEILRLCALDRESPDHPPPAPKASDIALRELKDTIQKSNNAELIATLTETVVRLRGLNL